MASSDYRLVSDPEKPRAPRARQRKKGSRSPFGPGLSLGAISNINITVDYSVFIIAALITFNLGAGLFPVWHPQWSPFVTWFVAVAAALFLLSILVHELSHAIVGRKFGIPIGGITLFIFGGMAHMKREPERPKAEFWMAIVGPLTSIVLGAAATAGAVWLAAPVLAGRDLSVSNVRLLGPLTTLLLWLGPLNIMLGVFNLVPGFPLDGGRVLRAVVWWATGDFRKATRVASFLGQLFAWLLISAGVFMLFGFRVPLFGTGVGQGIWLMLIGWFLNNAAKLSYEHVVLREALENVPVSRLMLTRLDTVPASLSIAELVHEALLHSDQRSFPVVSDGRLIGLVCQEDVRKIADAEWDRTSVSQIMTPRRDLIVLHPDDEAGEALRILAERDVDQLPVVEEDTILGLVRRQDIVKWVGLRVGPLSKAAT